MSYKIKKTVTYEQLESKGYEKFGTHDHASKIINGLCIMTKPNDEIIGYIMGSSTNFGNIITLSDLQIEENIKDLISSGYTELIKNKCERCESIETNQNYYIINDDKFCEDCILDELERLGDVESSTTTVYFLEGDYIGEEDEAIDTLISNDIIEKVSS
ncbi:MAG: hypothetical protein K8Q99_02045 [Acholeplasmataceae bacterium]|nr:hypothetical protein [Acholeplasmataceae bacterium]MCD4826547.1 hypothetical protein [Acholeplasmataceae bacterium]